MNSNQPPESGQPINPTSAEIAEAIANQRPQLFDDCGKVNPECTLVDLLWEMLSHDDIVPLRPISEHISRHALDDLSIIAPLAGMDGALFSEDIGRIADRARTWMQLAPEIERRIAAKDNKKTQLVPAKSNGDMSDEQCDVVYRAKKQAIRCLIVLGLEIEDAEELNEGRIEALEHETDLCVILRVMLDELKKEGVDLEARVPEKTQANP